MLALRRWQIVSLYRQVI